MCLSGGDGKPSSSHESRDAARDGVYGRSDHEVICVPGKVEDSLSHDEADGNK